MKATFHRTLLELRMVLCLNHWTHDLVPFHTNVKIFHFTRRSAKPLGWYSCRLLQHTITLVSLPVGDNYRLLSVYLVVYFYRGLNISNYSYILLNNTPAISFDFLFRVVDDCAKNDAHLSYLCTTIFIIYTISPSRRNQQSVRQTAFIQRAIVAISSFVCLWNLLKEESLFWFNLYKNQHGGRMLSGKKRQADHESYFCNGWIGTVIAWNGNDSCSVSAASCHISSRCFQDAGNKLPRKLPSQKTKLLLSGSDYRKYLDTKSVL